MLIFDLGDQLRNLDWLLSQLRVRYLPQVTLSSIGIQQDMVDMLVLTKETQLAFVIKSREVARTFREYFNVLWGMAGK